MGCGSSTEDKKTQAPKAAAVAKGPSAALAHEKAYLGDVRSISSAEYVLFAEMDARTASAFENADEPSDTSLALKRAVIVSRGKLKFGVNEDPDQYDASTDIPEFKQRDKKRVSEWVKAVALANPDGADSIPTSSFYLPDTRGGDSSHSSGGGRHPLEETTTSSGGVDIQLNKMDSFISQRTDQPDAWSNGGGGGGGKGKLYRSDADPLHCEDIDEARPVH